MSFVWCKQISTADTTGYATRSYFFRLKLSFGSISKSKVMFSFEIIGTSSIIKILKIKFQTLERTFVQFPFFILSGGFFRNFIDVRLTWQVTKLEKPVPRKLIIWWFLFPDSQTNQYYLLVFDELKIENAIASDVYQTVLTQSGCEWPRHEKQNPSWYIVN